MLILRSCQSVAPLGSCSADAQSLWACLGWLPCTAMRRHAGRPGVLLLLLLPLLLLSLLRVAWLA